jgi:Xaa-Pro aminopeptidase
MISDRVEQMRKYLKENNLFGIIIPSNDPHFGEYIQDYYKCREWISGFDGSAGTVVITLEEAALWTDSRYFIQAESQLKGSGIVLKKMKMPGTETIEQWLIQRFRNDSKIGIDAKLFSINDYKNLRENIKPFELELLEDPFIEIWPDRPARIKNKIILFDIEHSGEDTNSKHNRLNLLIGCKTDFSYIVTACEESAWLCNIRGSDVEYNPLPMLYAIVERNKIRLFCNLETVSKTDNDYLRKMGVITEDYNSFKTALKSIPDNHIRIASGDRISAGDYLEVTRDGAFYHYDRQISQKNKDGRKAERGERKRGKKKEKDILSLLLQKLSEVILSHLA